MEPTHTNKRKVKFVKPAHKQRKVYGILTAQLLLTCFVSFVFMYKPSVNAFVLRNASMVIYPW